MAAAAVVFEVVHQAAFPGRRGSQELPEGAAAGRRDEGLQALAGTLAAGRDICGKLERYLTNYCRETGANSKVHRLLYLSRNKNNNISHGGHALPPVVLLGHALGLAPRPVLVVRVFLHVQGPAEDSVRLSHYIAEEVLRE